jgi:hypothetical protein
MVATPRSSTAITLRSLQVRKLQLKRLQWAMLRRDEELAVEGGLGGAALQRFFGGKANKIGIVIFLGDMRQNKIARDRVKAVRVAKVFADSMIREMARTAEHALFDNPGIGADFQHIEVVIRFEDQTIRPAQMHLHQLGHVSEVRDNSQLRTVRAKREANGIGRVMGNRESVYVDITDGEMLARLNGFDGTKAFAKGSRKDALHRVHRGFGDVQRRLPHAEHLRQAVAVVRVFVRNEDGVEMLNIFFDGCEPCQRFALAQSGVHEEAGALGLEQRDVARTAGRQNGYPQADLRLP